MINKESYKRLTYLQLIFYAEQLFIQSNFSEALEYITDAIEMNHDDSWAYYLRGSIRHCLKDSKGSNADFQKCTAMGGYLPSDLDRLMNILPLPEKQSP